MSTERAGSRARERGVYRMCLAPYPSSAEAWKLNERHPTPRPPPLLRDRLASSPFSTPVLARAATRGASAAFQT